MAFSPNKKYLASGAGDGSIKIFDFETAMEDPETYSPFGSKDMAVAISPNGQIIAAGSVRGSVAGYDMKTKTKLMDLYSVHGGKQSLLKMRFKNSFSR